MSSRPTVDSTAPIDAKSPPQGGLSHAALESPAHRPSRPRVRHAACVVVPPVPALAVVDPGRCRLWRQGCEGAGDHRHPGERAGRGRRRSRGRTDAGGPEETARRLPPDHRAAGRRGTAVGRRPRHLHACGPAAVPRWPEQRTAIAAQFDTLLRGSSPQRFATLGTVLDYIESAPELFDADRLAFREVLRDLHERVSTDSSLPAVKLHQRIGEDWRRSMRSSATTTRN